MRDFADILVESPTVAKPAPRPLVSVVIPTQRRPEALFRALRSVIHQTGVDFRSLELVVVDNDQTDSARVTVEAFSAGEGFPVTYRHQPAPGVSNARNDGVAAARGDFIAFLDDDEEASAHWLADLLAAQKANGADVVFGPVRARLPETVVRHRAYLEHFFSRHGPAKTGVIDDFFGCGNSLIRKAALPNPDLPFPLERNQSGGEDDVVFRTMRTRGSRFAWSAEAWVWEHPAPERISLGYTLRRALAYGQGGTSTKAGLRPAQLTAVVWSMTTGALQLLVYAAAAAPLWIIGSPKAAFLLDRAARGLGKIFWPKVFYTSFYGLGATPGPAAPAA